VLNAYNFGGYLIASGVKTFDDGRTELYGEKFLLRLDRALELNNVGTLLRLLKQYHIDATLLAPKAPRIYADDVAVVYLKTGATPGSALDLKP
jgi:hypothetical protein